MSIKSIVNFSFAIGCLCLLPLSYASITIPMVMTDGNAQQKKVGTIQAENARCGVLFTPHLTDLPPGIHGFHIHEKPSCDDKGMAAGDHFDPIQSKQHNGPYDHIGHLGDLPVLIVNQDGTATLPILAPRLTLSKIKNHALMIHAGADNYADTPAKLGGGGSRMVCGVIK